MSQENVEIVREVFEALNLGDVERALAALDQDAVLDFTNSRGTAAGVYRGRDEVRAFWTSFVDAWSAVHWDLTELIDVDETRVVPVLHVRAAGRTSGIAVDAHTAHVWTMSDGKAQTVKFFQSKAEALEAVGLAE